MGTIQLASRGRRNDNCPVAIQDTNAGGADGPKRKALGTTFAAAGLYLGSFFLSTLFPATNGLVHALWPAGGIGLAAFLSLRRRDWPLLAVLLYSLGLGANIATGRPVAASFGFMAANIAESVVSALVISRFEKPSRVLRSTKGILGILVAALGVNAATACLGALTAALAHEGSFASFWFGWWVADGMSILIVMPVLLSFLRTDNKGYPRRHWLEYLLASTLPCLLTWFAFGGRPLLGFFSHEAYLVIIAFCWPAMRFGGRSLSLVLMVMAGLAVTGGAVLTGSSPLGGGDEVERLLLAQAFVAVIAICCWLLRATRAESEEALRRSEESRIYLKGIGDSIPNGFIYHYTLDAETGRRAGYISEGVERACGEPAERVLADLSILRRGIPEEDLEALVATYRAAAASGSPYQALYRRQESSGRVRWFLNSAKPETRPDGGEEWTGVELDITAQESLAARLRESESRFSTIFKESPAPAILTDMENGRILDANRAFELMFGHVRPAALGTSTLAIGLYADPRDRERMLEVFRKGATTTTSELELRTRDGIPIQGRLTAALVTLGKERCILSQFENLTKELRMVAELEDQRSLLALSQEIAHVGHWIWEPQSGRLTWSDEMYRIFGVDPANRALDLEEVIAKAIHPDDRDAVLAANERVRERGEPAALEYRIVHADGSIRQVWASPGEESRDEAGRIVRLYGVVQDISDRKRELDRLERVLAEREALLRELNHRTNNGLQVAIAILAAQASRTPDRDIQGLFTQAQERIEAMAIVQKKMSEGGDISRVDLASVLTGLWDEILQTRAGHKAGIQTDFRLEPVSVLVDTAIPFALAMNELLSNVVRHAYPGERQGTLAATLDRRGELVMLELRDDGVGVPEGFDPARDKGLGLEFVIGLCESQLRGEISFQLERGFGFRLSFRDNLYKARI